MHYGIIEILSSNKLYLCNNDTEKTPIYYCKWQPFEKCSETDAKGEKSDPSKYILIWYSISIACFPDISLEVLGTIYIMINKDACIPDYHRSEFWRADRQRHKRRYIRSTCRYKTERNNDGWNDQHNCSTKLKQYA